jgi:hypothetical protein
LFNEIKKENVRLNYRIWRESSRVAPFLSMPIKHQNKKNNKIWMKKLQKKNNIAMGGRT